MIVQFFPLMQLAPCRGHQCCESKKMRARALRNVEEKEGSHSSDKLSVVCTTKSIVASRAFLKKNSAQTREESKRQKNADNRSTQTIEEGKQ